MKKLLVAVVAVATLAIAMGAHAEEKYVAGGFEASGHINTGFGFNYTGKDSIGAGLPRDGWNFEAGEKEPDFGFLLDEAEVDLTKTYGENIKFRLDLDFGYANAGSAAFTFSPEQAYVTANLALGNGIEMLVGKFNAPIGFEAVDRNDNDSITHSFIYNFNIRPSNLIGMKFYYAFSDAVDWHFYLVNNTWPDNSDFHADTSVIPTVGTRLGYSWGDEGTESTIGLSGLFGPEQQSGNRKYGRMAFLVDLDFNFWATDAFAIGGEGFFRQNDAAKGAADSRIFGGLINLHYVFSDVWDGTLKYAIGKPNNGAATMSAALNPGLAYVKGWYNEASLIGGYQITDGAKFKAEYRLDYTKFTGVPKNMAHAFIGQFEYAF
jgi:hypothetical protein